LEKSFSHKSFLVVTSTCVDFFLDFSILICLWLRLLDQYSSALVCSFLQIVNFSHCSLAIRVYRGFFVAFVSCVFGDLTFGIFSSSVTSP